MQKKIIALGGSLRKDSYSGAALRAGMNIAARMGATTETLDLRELDLPMYIPNVPLGDYPMHAQEAVGKLIAAYRNADVMLWSTPTYHGSMSGALKNAIDYMEFLARDPLPYFQGRAIGLISVSDASPMGCMSNCVNELRAWLAPTRVTLTAGDFDADLTLTNPSATRRLTRLISELAEFNS